MASPQLQGVSNGANGQKPAEQQKRLRNLTPVTKKLGVLLVREIQRRAPRGNTAVRRGGEKALRASFSFKLLSPTSLSMRSPLPYARITNFGGIINKKDKMLTIPLNLQAARARARTVSLRSIKGLKLIIVRGRAFLVKVTGRGKRKKIEFWYILKDSVRIRAQRYMPSINEPAIAKRWAKWMANWVLEGRV